MNGTARWVVASDHAGVELKTVVLSTLSALGIAARDLGTHGPERVDYPDYAHLVAAAIAAGEYDRAVLVCGTGIGMSIAANRQPDVRAAACSEPYSARMARAHNDANVLCLGARVVGPGLADEIVRAFAAGEFAGGRHAERVAKIER